MPSLNDDIRKGTDAIKPKKAIWDYFNARAIVLLLLFF